MDAHKAAISLCTNASELLGGTRTRIGDPSWPAGMTAATNKPAGASSTDCESGTTLVSGDDSSLDSLARCAADAEAEGTDADADADTPVPRCASGGVCCASSVDACVLFENLASRRWADAALSSPSSLDSDSDSDSRVRDWFMVVARSENKTEAMAAESGIGGEMAGV